MQTLAPAWLPRVTYPIAGAAILALLTLHTLKWHVVRVDYVSATLLGLLIVLPVAQYIKRLRFGGSKLGSAVAKSCGFGSRPLSIVRRDPALGLAKLRLELEREIRRRYELVTDPNVRRRPPSIGQMMQVLQQSELLAPDVAAVLRDVLPLANRAVHGEYVRSDDAEEIARIGVRALEALKAETFPL
jgi:hypothetical protein